MGSASGSTSFRGTSTQRYPTSPHCALTARGVVRIASLAYAGRGSHTNWHFLAAWCPPSVVACSDVYAEACALNEEGGYGPIDAQLLYCFIRTVKPQRVVQVGGGVTAAVMLRASRDAGYTLDLTCVEPYSTRFLSERAAAGEIHLITERAQAVELECLTGLASGDLFCVDSTHTVKPGSEVNAWSSEFSRVSQREVAFIFTTFSSRTTTHPHCSCRIYVFGMTRHFCVRL